MGRAYQGCVSGLGVAVALGDNRDGFVAYVGCDSVFPDDLSSVLFDPPDRVLRSVGSGKTDFRGLFCQLRVKLAYDTQ